MKAATRIYAHDNDSFVLGEESVPITSPDVRRYKTWIIAREGAPHPNVCAACGTILKRTPIGRFKLRIRTFDLSVTYDGYYVVSQGLMKLLRQRYAVDDFHPIPGTRGFRVFDHFQLPVLEVDRKASGTRESELCPACGRPYYQLLGRRPGRPPTPRELVFSTAPKRGGLYRSDMEFGTTHNRNPVLVVHPAEAAWMEAQGIKGL